MPESAYAELRRYIQKQMDAELFFLTPQRRSAAFRQIWGGIKQYLGIKRQNEVKSEDLEQAKKQVDKLVSMSRENYMKRGVK